MSEEHPNDQLAPLQTGSLNEPSKADSLFLPLPDRQHEGFKCIMTSQQPLGFQLSFPSHLLANLQSNTNVNTAAAGVCHKKNCPCASSAA